MLPPEARLRRAQDFDRVRIEGRTWRHPFVIMGVCANNLAHSRFGFVVSKRMGTATARNRTRRRLREAVRLTLKNNRVKSGYDIVLIPRNEFVVQSYSEVTAAIVELLHRANLFEAKAGSEQ